jgi:hypothetical protein
MWNLFRRSLVGKPAMEITGDIWFNVTSFPEEARQAAARHSPLRFDRELAGTVTLINFWDYSSADCMADLSLLHAWWEQYEGPGFLLIGVHTPQYAFAEDPDKVESAVLRLHLDYPVVSDPFYTTWKRYDTKTWPRKLLVDAYGVIRADIRGKGKMDQLEEKLRKLLTQVRSHV